MTSLISVVIEGRCTTFICGCKKNHRWNLLFYPICLMMSSLIVEEVVFQPRLPGNLPQCLNPRSILGARGRSSLAASVGALVEERRKSREQSETVDKSISHLNEQKLQMQISRNLEENVNRLIETKKKLKTETDPGIIKVLRKYEKRLNKVIDMSSSSSSESDAD